MKCKLLIETSCTLGEGIFWDDLTGKLRWVDIHKGLIHSLDLETTHHQVWDVKQKIGWLIPTESPNEFIAGFQQGFGRVNLSQDTPEWAVLHPVFKDQPAMRLNDAKADADGVIWAGSLNDLDESKPDGIFFKFTSRGAPEVVETGYQVCNGPAISQDGKQFFHTDSAKRTIYSLTFSDGNLINKNIWKVLDPNEGYPDGMTFDSAGHVWVAHWGGGCISRFDLNGNLLCRVKIPAPNVTNITFGGTNLDRLFVSTARAGLSQKQLTESPQSGAIFEILGHDATGLPCRRYKGEP